MSSDDGSATVSSTPTATTAHGASTCRQRKQLDGNSRRPSYMAVERASEIPAEPDYDDTTVDSSLNDGGQAEDNEPLPAGKLNEFLWTPSPSAHAVRRRAILAAHPEIEQLYGTDPLQAVLLISTVVLQFVLAHAISKAQLSWPTFLVLCCTVGATLNHSLFAAMHEASHRTMIGSKLGSELLAIFASLPMVLPAAIPFKRYHLDHHIYMGVESMDPDLPTRLEGRLFRSALGKFLWVLLLPFTYSLRPLFVRPKSVLPIDVVAWIINLTADIFLYRLAGSAGVLYFLLGTFFSMNFHPFAGHFISEHYIFPEETDCYQETSSYYGSSNAITYNVGYHNEHHDFPRIPGSKLPLIRKIAPEFYAMPPKQHWWKATWDFILSPEVTPFNRVLREGLAGGEPPKGLPQKMVFHKGRFPSAASGFWPKVANIK